ncbi:MAG: type II toxin-antitoxin system RelB/DinJ family antitoxin [Deltaproteobacteria bacterium]|nr:type II toxin-antitoxin system RelB/DinJ family antitoxin [Deltaproteobacteria bacterium]
MAILKVQVDEWIQTEALKIVNAHGLSISDAVQVFLKKIAVDKRLPFYLQLDLCQNEEQVDSTLSKDEDLTSFPFFGMWADREDMKNPTKWVQNLRRGRFRDF